MLKQITDDLVADLENLTFGSWRTGSSGSWAPGSRTLALNHVYFESRSSSSSGLSSSLTQSRSATTYGSMLIRRSNSVTAVSNSWRV